MGEAAGASQSNREMSTVVFAPKLQALVSSSRDAGRRRTRCGVRVVTILSQVMRDTSLEFALWKDGTLLRNPRGKVGEVGEECQMVDLKKVVFARGDWMRTSSKWRLHTREAGVIRHTRPS